jgi:hypothetical protein
MARNFLQLWNSLLFLETKIRSSYRPWKIICSDFGLIAQQGFRGSYILAPLFEWGLPHVQIEGIDEAHNFGSQTFAIRGHLSLWIFTERSYCPGLREYLSGWLISLVNIHVPGVLRVDASVPRPFRVMFIVCLDLCRVLWYSLELLDELIPKVSSITLIYCVNKKLQNRHARVNLIPPRG